MVGLATSLARPGQVLDAGNNRCRRSQADALFRCLEAQ